MTTQTQQNHCYFFNEDIAEKLKDIDNNYILQGLGIKLFIFDVVNEVITNHPNATAKKIGVEVGSLIMTLLNHRIQTTKKEHDELTRRKERQQQKDKDIKTLERLYSPRIAQVIYFNTLVTYHNLTQKWANSMAIAINGIGVNRYNNIIERANR